MLGCQNFSSQIPASAKHLGYIHFEEGKKLLLDPTRDFFFFFVILKRDNDSLFMAKEVVRATQFHLWLLLLELN